ncbi:hypothetical protein TeGR_g10367 [Tetraparma gracilis]|uniref:Diacylglycerol glucosyltransferase N-terminal domain-containing protein n=1 Tax=Tetraparma gracilis TaxID=2962635 RepID=A0ABQ6MS33_9STRA|nr:hypothetical protein TeGR_g10367 [Tetraparma gracilis]
MLVLSIVLFLCLSPLAQPLVAPSAHRPSTAPSAPRPSTALLSTLSSEKPKIQFLICDTGGGHRASALSLRSALSLSHPAITCDIVDIYSYTTAWPFNSLPHMYAVFTKYSFLWDTFYKSGETPAARSFNKALTSTFCYDPFRLCLTRTSHSSAPETRGERLERDGRRADVVVSVHPLTQELPLKVLEDVDRSEGCGGRETPFVTVVTDLGSASATWFSPEADIT